ncbi:MAG: hypothetical protein ACREOJ_09385 [Gemmatimonadaceae bacterium]
MQTRRRCSAWSALSALAGVVLLARGASAQQSQRTWLPGSWSVVTSLPGNPNLLNRPGNIACTNQAIYAYDFGDRSLKALSLAGAPLWRTADAPGVTLDSTGGTRVQVAPDGHVWMTHSNMGLISVFSPGGAPLRTYRVAHGVSDARPNRDGSFWTWNMQETVPTLYDSSGKPPHQPPHQPLAKMVDNGARMALLASADDGTLAVVFVLANRLMLMNRHGKTIRSERGVGTPRAFPTMVAQSMQVAGRTLQVWRLGSGARVVASAASADGGSLFILHGNDSTGATPANQTVDSYSMTDGRYLGSYRLPEGLSALCVRGGSFIGLTDTSPPALRVWKFVPRN